ncbi:MAG: hypothetical protein NTU97_04555 [Candidatus Magasanikbacteria bacterium]|nr:hypothetical protein [Candidatus Magasanikbacteria bacterium]
MERPKRPNAVSRDVTADVGEMISLTPDQRVVLDGRGGWKIALSFNDKGELELEHFQPHESGAKKFFAYSTEGNQYGAGKIFAEPSLAVPVLEKGFLLTGALVLDEKGKVTNRFSWSNLVFIQKRRFEVTKSNRLLVSDPASGEMVPMGYLRVLFLTDKNRMTGYVGVFTPIRTRTVRILEMEDLLLASIM